MANPHKGELPVVAGNKTYTFCFSVDAICALEARLDRGLFDIAQELATWSQPVDIVEGKPVPRQETPEQQRARMSRVRMGLCRDVFWAGFQQHHPGMTPTEAGQIMTEVGGLVGAMEIIDKALAASFPPAEAAAPNPRQRTRR